MPTYAQISGVNFY